ncbi:MAG: hypothetical protein IH597_06425 [Bacteroidales bacterium]|nr:hypothetical protein [Bacteroidales bacterium]
MYHLKTIAIIIFLIAVATLHAQLPWTRISPAPQEHWINEIIRIPGTDRLMAACEGSTIMMSDDDGETWDLMMNPAGMNIQIT